MNKRIIFLFTLLIFFSFASASSSYYDSDSKDVVLYKEKITKTYYDEDDDYSTTRTIYAYYDNIDRYSTNNYRHGYSYRNSKDYWQQKHNYVNFDRIELRDYEDYDRIYFDKHYYKRYEKYYEEDYDWKWDYDKRVIQHRYIPYLKSYQERKCYDYTPRGKLLYISCDDWLY